MDVLSSDIIFRYFPACKRQIICHTLRKEVVSVYCSCRQPKEMTTKLLHVTSVTNGTISTASETTKYNHKPGQTLILTGLACAE